MGGEGLINAGFQSVLPRGSNVMRGSKNGLRFNQACHLLAEKPWVNYLTSLSFSFPDVSMRTFVS